MAIELAPSALWFEAVLHEHQWIFCMGVAAAVPAAMLLSRAIAAAGFA
jgi:hypothetical protein